MAMDMCERMNSYQPVLRAVLHGVGVRHVRAEPLTCFAMCGVSQACAMQLKDSMHQAATRVKGGGKG